MIVLTEVAEPTENVRFHQQQVQCYVENNCLGDGSISLTERSVTWINRETKKGFSLTYPSIILHAVSTDISTFHSECIYVLVDCSRAERRRPRDIPLYTAAESQHVNDLNMAEQELNEDVDEADSDTPPNVSIRFVPTDTSVLSQIYDEMSLCQELNPDEDDISDEDEGMEDVGEVDENGIGFAPPNGGQWITAESLANADGDVELSEEGLANLQRMLGGGRQNQQNEDEDME